MTMNTNTLTPNQRTKALKTRLARPVNPYLFDVRKDKAICDLLRDCADDNLRVNLPVGAYLIEVTEAVDRMYNGSALHVLVNPKGVCKFRDAGMDTDYHTWLKCVKKFLCIKD